MQFSDLQGITEAFLCDYPEFIYKISQFGNGQVSQDTQNIVSNTCCQKMAWLDFEALYRIFQEEDREWKAHQGISKIVLL